MLKSRALILSGSNGDDESQAPRQTDTQTDHIQGRNLFLVIHLCRNTALLQQAPPPSSDSPAPFSHPGSPFSTSSPVILALYLPPPPPPPLASCLLSLPNLYPPPTSIHTRAHTHTYTHIHISHTPASCLTLINGD